MSKKDSFRVVRVIVIAFNVSLIKTISNFVKHFNTKANTEAMINREVTIGQFCAVLIAAGLSWAEADTLKAEAQRIKEEVDLLAKADKLQGEDNAPGNRAQGGGAAQGGGGLGIQRPRCWRRRNRTRKCLEE